jgi:hypothetical protein
MASAINRLNIARVKTAFLHKLALWVSFSPEPVTLAIAQM